MPKKTRKEKSRGKNDLSRAILTLQQRYYQVVEDAFTFNSWIFSMVPEDVKYQDVKYLEVLKWFIIQTMVYSNVFAKKDEEGKMFVELNKGEFEIKIKSSSVLNNQQYSDTFTKEMIVEFVDVLIQRFYSNDMIVVKDSSINETNI